MTLLVGWLSNVSRLREAHEGWAGELLGRGRRGGGCARLSACAAAELLPGDRLRGRAKLAADLTRRAYTIVKSVEVASRP